MNTFTPEQQKAIARAESAGFRVQSSIDLGLDIKTASARDARRLRMEQAFLKKANHIVAAIKEVFPDIVSPYPAA